MLPYFHVRVWRVSAATCEPGEAGACDGWRFSLVRSAPSERTDRQLGALHCTKRLLTDLRLKHARVLSGVR